ncbi:hypothetical protein [Lentibacillus salinarum]|uniref:Uncharacterized protein n=1 Tax=Lentibacillus salinarum TaxID=446820 RepID=A0ABW3ZSD0_9BACI
MAIVINMDVMLAKRKMSVTELIAINAIQIQLHSPQDPSGATDPN